jgi:ABC-type nitrate/sulfonate/bicarbonate transport system substrate-binding protein
MNRLFLFGIGAIVCLTALTALKLGGDSSAPTTSSPLTVAKTDDAEAPDQTPRSDAEARQAVEERFNVTKYLDQDFIPKPGAPPPQPVTPKRTVRVGLYWVLNDEFTPWFVGIDKGFFADQGLDIQFEEGGQNRDPLGSLFGNHRVDIYVGPAETPLFFVCRGAQPRILCAVMKQMPVGWIGIDKSIPKNQRSTKQIGPADLKGRVIGLDADGRYIASVVAARLGIKIWDFHIVTAGATPDGLMAGKVDYYTAFSENQPRILERNGFMNWTFFPFSKVGYDDYYDVSTVTADFCKNHPDVVAGYVFALKRSLQYIIDHPDEAAEIAAKHSSEYPVTKAEALWRVKKDIPLYIGNGSGLLSMDPAVITKQVTLLYQYHQMSLPAK